MWSLAVLVLSAIAAVFSLPTEPGDLVKLAKGSVRGVVDGPARRYALRYAQPPTGKLRFEPPQPVDAWSDV